MRTDTIIGLAVLCLASFTLAEEPYQPTWLVQGGSGSDDNSMSAAVDSSGNVYITGFTRGDLAGVNAGFNDVSLTKFDAAGNELWARQLGTSQDDYSYSLALDALGNAYITGSTEGDLGGSNAGSQDAFLTKFDPSGNELWSTQVGTTEIDNGSSVTVDVFGHTYISGWTGGDLGGTNAGGYDAYLTKFDSSGNVLWSRQIGTEGHEECTSIAVDSSGNTYISGLTTGDLGGTNAGSTDAFLFKFDASGNELWSRQLGMSGADQSDSVAVDLFGNVYISGYTENALGKAAGGHDAFLTKFDAAGNELWTTQIGTVDSDYSKSIVVDALGNAYISGSTQGDLGGVNVGPYDIFLTKLDPSGNELWSQQIGTAGTEIGNAVALDASGNAYLTGYTTGTFGGINAGGDDFFLAKLVPVPEPATMSLLALGGVVLLRKRR